MDRHTYLGKRKVGSTDICDFTDYQGVGHDPLYKRYESVYSIIRKYVDQEYIHFFAAPAYSPEEDAVNWYIDEWTETPERIVELQDAKREKYIGIKERTISHYKEVLERLSGEELQVMASAMRYIDDEFIYCADDKVYVLAWGMTPDTRNHVSKGELVHEAPLTTKYKLTFEPGEKGTLANKLGRTVTLREGSTISNNDLPKVDAQEGYKFTGWNPNPIGKVVNSDMVFEATYEERSTPPNPPEVSVPLPPPPPSEAECKFNVGEECTLKGSNKIYKPVGSRILANEIPLVTPKKGFKFKGWDVDPNNYLVKGDTTFNAVIEKNEPWYKRFWLWVTGSGCLKWLLWILLLLLLLLLLCWLLRGCKGCTKTTEGVVETEKIVTASGDTIDDNGVIRPIELHDGRLPQDNSIVAPIHNEDGSLPPIVREPGVPPVIADRLFLFLENENDNIDDFAADFKKAYPGNQYNIIGYDREVKSLLIQIPETEKDDIRRTINSKLPNHQFIVFDEEIYELNGNLSATTGAAPGWHLAAVKAQEGWNITRGDPSVVVAVLDDGIDASHPIFQGRIVNAYNIYTQNNNLSKGEGHGTHTAGLAVGSDKYFSQGAAGIAPNCKLMPVQVMDNNMCPLSALVSGVMYAVHKGADVVNISIGPSFQGLNQLPVELQNEIAQTQFKNVEKLWNRVCKLAADRNTILVFAAGNDDILSSVPPENRTSVAITVGAVDQNLYPTEFTNYGPCTDISAPGKEIYSSFPGNEFRSFDGTSMAAPIVTGTIALMKSLKKDLTVKQAYNVLYNTGADVYGFMPPMVQVNLALDAVKRGDFSEPKERTFRSVPDSQGIPAGTDAPSSWETPAGGIIVEEGPGRIGEIGDANQPISIDGNEQDYDAIRKLIAKYKQKIKELEGQLPENKR